MLYFISNYISNYLYFLSLRGDIVDTYGHSKFAGNGGFHFELSHTVV